MIENATLWYAIRIEDKQKLEGICEELAMNGCTYNTDLDDILFIAEPDIRYALKVIGNITYDFI